jgi:hypothetical protein
MREFFTVYHRGVSLQRIRGRSLLRVKERALGSQIVEFGSALFLLFVFIFLPLLDLAIVPIRWMMAQELINTYVRTLAMCETYTQSLCTMEADPSLRARLLNIGGIEVTSTTLYLTITRTSMNNDSTKFIEVRKPGAIPDEWLPDGKLAPCQYLMVLDVKATISPAVLLKWGTLSIPGLTKPIPISIVVLHDWGNLGKDPASEKYFMNE